MTTTTTVPFQSTGSALTAQIGGDHYRKLKIQPVEYIHANNIPFIEGCIIKYASRWRDKGGVRDLEKIKHFVDLLIELEAKKNEMDPAVMWDQEAAKRSAQRGLMAQTMEYASSEEAAGAVVEMLAGDEPAAERAEQ